MAAIRMTIGLAVGLLLFYWLFVIAARSMLHVDLPDPADLFPADLRRLVPHR